MFQILAVGICLLFYTVLIGTVAAGDLQPLNAITLVVLAIAILGLLVPQLAVQVRRFHDQDRSGWLVLLNLVPYVGWLVVLIVMLFEGTNGPNRYGPEPDEG